MLTAFAIVSVLGTVLDSAGGAPNQKEKSPSTAAKDKAAPSDATPPDAATSSLPSPELAAVKVAIALARRGELVQASDVEEGIGDPVARQVVEWAILRSDKNEIDFRRHVAFISDNPSWPGIGLLRRRAEAALWKERLDPQTVRAYLDKDQPLTAQGKFALARALLLEGDRSDAQSLVREAWRYDRFQAGLWLRPLTMDVRT
jgi:soluble lytic murein transglycosylase